MRLVTHRIRYDASFGGWRAEYYEEWLTLDGKPRSEYLDESEPYWSEGAADIEGALGCEARNRPQIEAHVWCWLWIASRASVASNTRPWALGKARELMDLEVL